MKRTPTWVFRHGDCCYWVGAPDAEAAKRLLAPRDPEAAKTEPERLGNGAGDIEIGDGVVLGSKVDSKGTT